MEYSIEYNHNSGEKKLCESFSQKSLSEHSLGDNRFSCSPAFVLFVQTKL